MNKIIAIVGMCGSGKSVACNYLENKGYKTVYFGGVTMQILKEKGLEINEQNEKIIREDLRKNLGMGAYAIKLLPQIESLYENNDVVLDGLYSWDEYVILKNHFKEKLKMIAIICDKDLRYNRLSNRDVRPYTLEQAEKRDIAEIENMAKGGPIAFADYYIDNNGNIDQYYQKLEEILRRM